MQVTLFCAILLFAFTLANYSFDFTGGGTSFGSGPVLSYSNHPTNVNDVVSSNYGAEFDSDNMACSDD
jgi:hypothetical protein